MNEPGARIGPYGPTDLLQVSVDELGQLEHRYLILAKNRTQFSVSADVAAIAGVLQVVLFDVVPDSLGDLGARHGFGANDRSEFGAGRQGLHESGVRLARGGGGCGHFAALLLWMMGKLVLRGSIPCLPLKNKVIYPL